jgi:outer membrane lipoprotein SlyB
MKRALIAVALVALAGCANRAYYNPDVTQAQADRDLAQCHYEARRAVTSYGTGGSSYTTISGAAGQGVAEGIGQATDIREIEHACLKARGYSLQSKH